MQGKAVLNYNVSFEFDIQFIFSSENFKKQLLTHAPCMGKLFPLPLSTLEKEDTPGSFFREGV
jgi:hypothetical protein